MKLFLPKLICLLVAIIGFEIDESSFSSAYAGAGFSSSHASDAERNNEEVRRERHRRASGRAGRVHVGSAREIVFQQAMFRGHTVGANIDFGALSQALREWLQIRVAHPAATPAPPPPPATQPLNPTQYQALSESDIREDQRGQIECPICLNELIQRLSVGVVRVNCNPRRGAGHMFCKPCIETAYRSKQDCPVCRGQLNSNSRPN